MNDPPVVVLVEGHSDVAALEVLAQAQGVRDRLELVAMGGVTNIRHHLGVLAAQRPEAIVLGVCDAGERRYLERADGLAGVFVCDRDLEDELIRAVGPEQVVDLLDELGELRRFRTFQDQPEWRGRELVDQLQRFAGTKSGRKAVFARSLAQAIDGGRVPLPLAQLFEAVQIRA
ncbi:hypothetical protein [Nocardioides sp.]|uniref:hypothetical protein n=1 Tax=Nocardioides sp. TaxID=35761 RepID=UPI002ED13B08